MVGQQGMDSHGRRNFSEMDAATLSALGLKKEMVFVPVEEPKPRSANAERVARHRQNKARKMSEAGLDTAVIPKDVAERIKALGFEAWLVTIQAEAVAGFSSKLPTIQESLGAKVCGTKGWRRRLIDLLLR